MLKNQFLKNGWVIFNHDPVLIKWVEDTLPMARKFVSQPENQHWLRCAGTWFAGVNLLNNDVEGRVNQGPRLNGTAIDFIISELNYEQIDWDPGQISVCYPGYPRPMDSESQAAFQYRLKRDAAHIDGLLPEGKNRRRHLREHHGFILGIPMVKSSVGASPLVIWQGSHEIVRQVFSDVFANLDPSDWGDVDVTEIYQQTRRKIFQSCRRVELFAKPGQAYIVHRLALHGVAPWHENATASEDGRMICYFRPEINGPWEWLNSA